MATTADAKTREKLKEYRDRLQTLRADRTRLRTERDQAREAASDLDPAEAGIFDKPEFKQLEGAVKGLGECEDEISSLEAAEKLLLSSLGGTDPITHTNGRGDDPAAVHGGSWNAFHLLEASEAYHEARGQGIFKSDAKYGTVTLGRICGRDELAYFLRNAKDAPSQQQTMPLPGAPEGPVGTHQGAVPPDYRGLQPFILRPLTFLDMVPSGTTDSNIIEYVQITAIPAGADVVAEGAVKPQAGLTFEDATSAVRTIAVWIKMNRVAMDDMPFLASTVNTLLPNDVRTKLEQQCLNGDGTGQNLLGLMNVAGVLSAAQVAGDTIADAILRGITQIVLTDQNPNFVTLNPLTWQDLAISKAEGSGEYMFGYPGHYNMPTIYGLAATQNRMIDPLTPLVGDSSGHQLLVREGLNLKTSDADQDDFVRNRVTVLAETRAAYIVWRPSAFCEVTLLPAAP